MRTLPAGLAAHLSGVATTLATCWIVRRTDGVTLGFTDHDRVLTMDGVTCEPSSGFDRTAATRQAGFAAGEEEVAGALFSDRIEAADLSAGRWDGASVEVHLVNWGTPEERVKLRTARIGEVTRADGAFRAELRGPAAALDQPTGRLFSRSCDAELGDGRCGVALSGFTTTATVAAAPDGTRLRVTGIDGLAAGWFARGTIAFAGTEAAVAEHLKDGGEVWLVLRRRLVAPPPVGTVLTLTAGCDKRFSTCRDKFANTVNFRGFPHMPGRDFVFSWAGGDGDDDGGVLF